MKSLNASLTSASRVKRFCNNKWTHVIMRSIFSPINEAAVKAPLGPRVNSCSGGDYVESNTFAKAHLFKCVFHEI